MSLQVSRGSAGEHQSDERAGVAGLSLILGQVSWGSAGEYQADERAGVVGLSRAIGKASFHPREVSWVIFFIADFNNWLALSAFPED